MIEWMLGRIKGTIFHPQWLSDRFHAQSNKILADLHGALILDIGSGNARYLDFVDKSNSYISVDYPMTNSKYLGRPMAFADARCMPFKSEVADVVLLFEVLEHVTETERVLSEIRRVLRRDGKLFISVPFIYPIHDAPNDYWRFTKYGLKEALVMSGFELRDIATHGNTLVVALQMANLGLLEICRDFRLRSKWLGFICALMLYPITLLLNIFALPLLYLPVGKAGCFGYFVIARKKDRRGNG
jgi:SAM-dependent methyltransferase